MVQIQAFRGLRYDLAHVGSLSDVVAPPYDVIDATLQDQLYKRHPANVIRLILNRDEPGDAADERYERAARYLKNWRREGVLMTEADPAIYVYHQVFRTDAGEFTRHGFMARLTLEPFGEGSVFPHEETHAAAKADRLKLLTACRTNLSQIFGIYPDPQNEVQQRLQSLIEETAPLEATDHLGVIHRMWPLTDIHAIGEVAALMSDKPVFVADGHHRYETACNYRNQLREQGGLDPNHPANTVLMMFVGMSDPGMIVLPTHRLFRGAPALDAAELAQALGDCFQCQTVGQGPDVAEFVWPRVEAGGQGALGLYTAKDQTWTLAELTAEGAQRMEQIAADRSLDWQGLGVGILHRLVMEDLLQAHDMPKAEYVHQVAEVIEHLTQDEAGEYPLAALVMPATLDHIRAISENAERMPPKSTYFYPKLLSGLVLNPLE